MDVVKNHLWHAHEDYQTFSPDFSPMPEKYLRGRRGSPDGKSVAAIVQ
jgi:hypothetical protein